MAKNFTTVSIGGNSDNYTNGKWDPGAPIGFSTGNERYTGASQYTEDNGGLNQWAPNDGDIFGADGTLGGNNGGGRITFDQSSVKKLPKDYGTKTEVTTDSPESLLSPNIEQPSQSSKPKSLPSTRPYIWKYQ